jgi:hypothetical protein
MSKKKKLGLLLFAIILLGLFTWLFNYYVLTFTPILVRFDDGVTKNEAVQTIAKYDKSILTRDPQEYDNSLFCVLEPFDRGRVIEFEAPRILRSLLDGKISQENGVKEVRALKSSYKNGHKYANLFEQDCHRFLDKQVEGSE